MTQQRYEDQDTVTYLYDNDGALSTVIDSASGSKTKYFYDFAGRLAKFTEDRGSLARRVEYTYDAWGNILSISGSMKDTLRIFFCTQKEMTPIPTRRWCQNWCQTKFDMSYFAIKSHKNK